MSAENEGHEQTPPPGADTDEDTTSDPSLDDGENADWSGEGGATVEGPVSPTSD